MIALRHPLLKIAALLLILTVLAVATAITAAGQEVDWRTSLILHFEPLTAGSAAGDAYLKSVADALESGWDADAVVVGPLAAEDGGLVLKSDASGWTRLADAARANGAVLIVRVDAPSSKERMSALADWARDSRLRHFILDNGDDHDSDVLRTALDGPSASTTDSAPSTRSWIAASTDAQVTRFDAAIESIPADRFADDAALDRLYADLAVRTAESPRPIIAAVSDVARHDPARVLMAPGALQITIGDQMDNPELWRQVAAFRARHPAVALGDHIPLVNNSFAFARKPADAKVHDTVVVVLGASGHATINVSRVFTDNTMLQDALTGRTAFVSFGMAGFEVGPTGILLIEEAF